MMLVTWWRWIMRPAVTRLWPGDHVHLTSSHTTSLSLHPSIVCPALLLAELHCEGWRHGQQRGQSQVDQPTPACWHSLTHSHCHWWTLQYVLCLSISPICLSTVARVLCPVPISPQHHFLAQCFKCCVNKFFSTIFDNLIMGSIVPNLIILVKGNNTSILKLLKLFNLYKNN